MHVRRLEIQEFGLNVIAAMFGKVGKNPAPK
jgi:hypothetical protein